MSTDTYFQQVEQLLAPLNPDERFEAIEYFKDYAQDANLDTGDALVAQLGTPKQLSRQILADYSIKATENQQVQGTKTNNRSTMRQIWLVLLAILSLPMAIPLAITVFVLIGAAIIVLISILGSIWITIAAVTISGFFVGGVSLYAAVGLVLTNFMTAVTYLGMGIAGLGLGLILIPVLKWFTQASFRSFAKFFRWVYQRLSRRRQTVEVADK